MSGMLKISPQLPPAMPPISSATLRVTWLPTGIQVGFGWPWPCFEVILRPNRPRLV
ncbi:Uncharacterised protein [Mycobacteroides abscessus subsp. abscessus]|nr:Uncharacterised protein [Mycobacteroides abscessus subsp. abscessus]